MATPKRKRAKAPPPLGVLEFSSALNGDDPALILKKLRQFVNIAGYERHLALSPSPSIDEDADADNAADTVRERDRVEDNDASSNDEEDSFLSDDDDDGASSATTKRQKLNPSNKKEAPSWQIDKNNYQVPFVGTSVAKGAIGSVTQNVWPTGFLEVYLKHSPMGVELIDNDYIGGVPPNGGVHKGLWKENSSSIDFRLKDGTTVGGKRRMMGGGLQVAMSRGQILSMAIQSNYWMALSEWILGFVSPNILKNELHWKGTNEGDIATVIMTDGKDNKCTVPPPVMTVLMKRRLPQWIDVIREYTQRQHRYAQQRQKEKRQQQKKRTMDLKKQQQQRQNQKHPKKEGNVQRIMTNETPQTLEMEEKKQRQIQKRQQREETLLLSALRNIIALCHLSHGTAREVLRKITAAVAAAPSSSSSGGPSKSGGGAKGGNRHGGGNKSPGGPGDNGGGSSWMVQLFQQQSEESSFEPQLECLRLACTLLETRDYVILSRATEVPVWMTLHGKQQGGKNSKGGGGSFNPHSSLGVACIALRHGVQRLLELERRTNRVKRGDREEEERDDEDGVGDEIDAYARCTTRLLRDIREVILPPTSAGEHAEDEGAIGGGEEKGFVLGIAATAELLSGEVLSNLTKLSFLAPPLEDATTESIQNIIDGNDVYEQLSPIETTSVEARRIIYLLLVDTRRSPFLYSFHHGTSSSEQSSKIEEQSIVYLSQLSKSLHSMLADQGHGPSTKLFLRTCLQTTPGLVAHFFRGLQLSDPKPTYRSLSALTFVEGVLRDAPLLPVGLGSLPTEQMIIAAIIPSCITKPLLGKAIQSPSALLVSSGLKLIITTLRRARDGISSLMVRTKGGSEKSGEPATEQSEDSLRRAVMQHLPEASLLFSIPSRFDPFLKTTSSRANALVLLQLCEAVQCYIRLDPSSMTNVKFDWARLVPNNEHSSPTQHPPQKQVHGPREFGSAEPLVQHRILQTLLDVSRSSQTTFSSKMLRHVLSILVSTKIPEVYGMARKLGLSLMERELFSKVISLDSSVENDGEAVQCQKYEASLWIDGISGEMIQELVTMMEETKQRRVQHKITMSQAWSDAGMGYAMPRLGVSSLLSSSICRLVGAAAGKENISPFSKEVSLLLVQLATQMLLFQAHPKPLAAIIAFSVRDGIVPEDDARVVGLYRVAKNILDNDLTTNDSVESLVSNVFLPESRVVGIVQAANAKRGGKRNALLDASRYASPAALRQCMSMMRYSGGRNNEQLSLLLRKIIILVLESGENDTDVVSRFVAMFNTNSSKSADIESTLVLLLSAARSKEFGPNVKSLLNCNDTMKPESVGMGVVSELLRCSLVPEHNGGTFIMDVWRYCSAALQSDEAHTSDLKDFLLTILLHSMPAAEENPSSPPLFPPAAMFDTWALVAGNLRTKLEVEFCLRLESSLAAIFESMNDGHGTWLVYQRVCSLTPQVFVKLCVNTLWKRWESGEDSLSSTLLSSVLEYDCSSFSCLSTLYTSLDADSNLVKLWDCGRLDFVAASFVLQTSKQKGSASEIVATEPFRQAADIIGKRFLTLLSQQHEVSDKKVTIGVILDVVEALCSDQFILLETQQSIFEIFCHMENGSNNFLGIEHELRIMKLATFVASSSNKQGPNALMLLTKAVARCCKLLPKHIKKMLRTKQEGESLWVESIAQTFSTLIEIVHSFDEKSSHVIDNCIVACLKYGMMDSNEFASCSAFGGCLKVVRMLMTKSHGPGSTGMLGSFLPAQVHAMAVSHSSFQCALSRSSDVSAIAKPPDLDDYVSEDCNGLSQQLELIRLLLCTISLGANHVKVENETLATILSVYNASANAVDGLLRRLLFLYEKHCSCKDEIMMNNLRWGQISTDHNLQNINEIDNGGDESWEWFMDALELDRVRSTLSQFPVTDTLEPQPSATCPKDSNDEINKNEQLVSSDVSEEESVDDDSISEIGSTSKKNASALSSSMDVKDDLWRGAGDDLRYSPGFILPLILATLEAHLPHEMMDTNGCRENADEVHPDNENVNRNEEEIAQYQAFGCVCRRVCDRGAIALAIASLSSRCPCIRKVAVAICGLFLKALQMQESHGIKSWRERPQLEMIMSSIQRGLAVRRAVQIQRYDAQEGIEFGGSTTATHKYNIPMLPAVSAVFLAKALLILSKPRDEMYGQMNRYFLKLADYHGAFQDCFGLPAFLSLYCSSSEELSRCRVERHWALLSLKDGAVDEFCYKIISQHHVPELIMSSFDSLVDNPDTKSELYLTIDVIETLLQSGGTRAANHLIKRQGLLSWLHGTVSWRNTSSVFPYEALRCRFQKLVATAVDSYRCMRHARGDDTDDDDALEFYEKVPLANAVIRICLDGADTTENSGSSNAFSPSLLENTCDALWAIHLADKQSQFASTSSGSTSIHDASYLLEKSVCHMEIFGKLLASMCDLPLVTNETGVPAAKLFCELALGFVLEMTREAEVQSCTILLPLKKVSELMKRYSCLGNDAKILSQVMKCRHLAITVVGGIEVWEGFLPYLGGNIR